MNRINSDDFVCNLVDERPTKQPRLEESERSKVVVGVEGELLKPRQRGGIDESELEFAEDVCEAILPLFLQQALLRELVYMLKVTNPASGLTATGAYWIHHIPQAHCSFSARISDRIATIIKSLSRAAVPSQGLPNYLQWKAGTPARKLVVSTMFGGSTDPLGGSSENQLAACNI